MNKEQKAQNQHVSQHISNEMLAAVLSELKPGDYIAFEWAHGIFGKEIIVDNITSVEDEQVLVHFLYGSKSEAEWVKKKDIIVISDTSASGKIKGWSGNFNILLPNHELLSNSR